MTALINLQMLAKKQHGSGLAVSKMPHVRQSHPIKHVLYYGV